MKIIHYLAAAVVLMVAISLVGCGGATISAVSGENQMVFGEDIRLTADLVPFHQIIAPQDLAVKQGLFVVSNDRSDTVINVYEIPSLDYRNGGIRKGRGPGEISSFAMISMSPDSSCINVWGFGNLASIRKIDISSPDSLRFVSDLEIGKSEVFNDMNLINDSLLVYSDMRNLRIVKYDIVQHKELGEIKFEKDPHGERFFYSNRGMVLCNDSLIIYVYNFKKQIDIYDLHTLDLKNRISDGKKYEAPTPSMFAPLVMQYVNVYAGKKFFYANGGVYESLIPFDNVKIEAFDYEGNPVARYSFDKGPRKFVVDENNSMIYGYNSKTAPNHWLRYKIAE